MLTSRPKTLSEERIWPSAHTLALSSLHIPVLLKHVVGRSKVGISYNALHSEEVSRAGERRHPPELQVVLVIEAVQKRPFSSKVASFYRAIMVSTGRRLGSLDATNPLTSYYTAQNEQGDNPRHL